MSISAVKRNQQAFYFLLFVLALHLVLLVSTQFTAWPEMFAYPWLISKGFNFYKDIVHPYQPGLPYLLFMFYRLVGFSLLSLKALTYFVLILCDLCIYLLTVFKFGKKSALLSVLFFVLTSTIFEANGLWFDLAGVPFLLVFVGSLFFYTQKIRRRYAFFIGLLLGCAVLFKQTYLAFLIPTFITLGFSDLFLLVVVGVFAPIFVLMSYYFFSGQSSVYFYWGWYYPIFILSKMPGFLLLPTVKQLGLSLLIFSPIIALIKFHWRYIICLVVAVIFAFPRFAYFHLLPGLALLSLFLPLIIRQIRSCRATVLFLTLLILALLMSIRRSVFLEDRFMNTNSQAIRTEIEASIPQNTPVYFYNVAANYFVLSTLQTIKPWVDTFPWYLEVPGMQEKIIAQLVSTPFVVMDPFTQNGAYELGSYKPELIDAYIRDHYRLKLQLSNGYRVLIKK